MKLQVTFYLTEFHNLKRVPDEEIRIFITHFEGSNRKVEAVRELVSEQYRSYKLIHSIEDSYKYVQKTQRRDN